MPPEYRYPRRIMLSILRDFIIGNARAFRSDSAHLAKGVSRMEIVGDKPCGAGPFLFLINHYSHRGFRAWWIAIALTAAAGRDLHWPMTAAWTFPDPLRSRIVTPAAVWALARIARMYGFTLMPPMPPRAKDAAARADAVRRILRLARREKPSIGMAPEGMDSPDGRLTAPPAGAGRFIALLVEAGYTPVPVGIYEEGDALRLRFGKPFAIPKTAGGDPDLYDRGIRLLVMKKIGELLPEDLTPPPSPTPSHSPFWEGGRGTG